MHVILKAFPRRPRPPTSSLEAETGGGFWHVFRGRGGDMPTNKQLGWAMFYLESRRIFGKNLQMKPTIIDIE